MFLFSFFSFTTLLLFFPCENCSQTNVRLHTLRDVYDHHAGRISEVSKKVSRLRTGQEEIEERLENICGVANDQRVRCGRAWHLGILIGLSFVICKSFAFVSFVFLLRSFFLPSVFPFSFLLLLFLVVLLLFFLHFVLLLFPLCVAFCSYFCLLIFFWLWLVLISWSLLVYSFNFLFLFFSISICVFFPCDPPALPPTTHKCAVSPFNPMLGCASVEVFKVWEVLPSGVNSTHFVS